MSSLLLNDDQRRDWLRLIKSENIGPVSFFQLINRFGGASQALAALPELSRRGGLRRAIRIYAQADAERDLAAAHSIGARFVALGESDYPDLLRHIDSPPPLVCIKGNTSVLKAPAVAIVGSRNASAVGRKFARQIARELGQHGYTIISGLARGIDTAAHEAALDAGTVAVLAGGLDVIYPPENADVHSAIAERGLLISEMTPGTKPKAEFFPRRNRIISGMSLGVVVVEAAIRSGSLITARLAGEQGREVFSVPGSPLDPRATGTNKLIKDGATLITSARDILEVVDALPTTNQGLEFDFDQDGADYLADGTADNVTGDNRTTIVTLLGPSPVEVDVLIRESGCAAQAVATVLLELELAGRLARHSGQRVSLL